MATLLNGKPGTGTIPPPSTNPQVTFAEVPPSMPSIPLCNGLLDADLEPGIYYDKVYRIFRLRCTSSMYAFRVDDARNLEHLYWGPSLPNTDNILYLTKAHVPAPFDPSGAVSTQSIAKALGLGELRDIADEDDIQKLWKVAREQRGATDSEEQRGRRLENASWRLWRMERNRGGDLNFDLSQKMEEKSLHFGSEHDTTGSGAVSPAVDHVPRPASPPSLAQIHPGAESMPTPIAPGTPGRVPRRISSTGGMFQSRSVGFLAGLDLSEPEAPDLELGVAAKQEYLRTSKELSSPRLVPHSSSSALSTTTGGSASDLTFYNEMTWEHLDPATVGKSSKLLEYSDVGTGDYREPSFRVKFHKDGSSICPLEYKTHKILHRKPVLPSPLPGVYTDTNDEATTLIVDMQDPITKLKIQLHYTVMHDYDVITRRTVVVNEGTHPVTLQSLASATVDFDAEYKYYMTQLSGGWARERHVVTRKLEDGVTVVKSGRGTSSHQFNPFVVISPEREPSENDGECYGFCFVYSGNFAITAEVSEYRRLRVNVGINPEMFRWHLDSVDGEENRFSSPELIMSYSDEGLGKMSRAYHRVIRERVVPKAWRYKVPPVLLNTWEAVYFDVSHEVIAEIARSAATADIELLVMDDGWFGKRDNTHSGLGDWTPNRKKLPYGVDGLARTVNEAGLKFGIWIEPEMVSIDSELFRTHPDYCLCVPERSRTTGRNQLVLDFSRPEVVDHILQQLVDLLSSANIEYVKWDMNRHLTEIFSQKCLPERQGEISHRYMLGVYECLRRLTTKFPNVLFETCSGGGGRFDAGMIFYAPQIWASDNTDALSRVKIQYGSSLVYPMSTMGAHVSSVPNHQTMRSSTMKTRSLLAMAGTFGYELDPREWTPEIIEEIKGYIRMQKRIAPLIYEGDLYRLWSPFSAESCAWMFLSRDKYRGIVMAFNVRKEVGRLDPRLRLKGLHSNVLYCVEELCPGTITVNPENGAIITDPRGVYQFGKPMTISGQTLSRAGLPVKFLFDGDSVCYEVNAVRQDGTKLSSY